MMAYAERLSAVERLLECVMLGLRLRDGFDLAEAEARCGCALEQVAPRALATLCAEGWLERNATTLCLTPAGFPLANTVMARLMAE